MYIILHMSVHVIEKWNKREGVSSREANTFGLGLSSQAYIVRHPSLLTHTPHFVLVYPSILYYHIPSVSILTDPDKWVVFAWTDTLAIFCLALFKFLIAWTLLCTLLYYIFIWTSLFQSLCHSTLQSVPSV